jgi:alkyl hydroperoxide reductase subunit AhpC
MARGVIADQHGGKADVRVAGSNYSLAQTIEGFVAQDLSVHDHCLQRTPFHPFRLQAPINTGLAWYSGRRVYFRQNPITLVGNYTKEFTMSVRLGDTAPDFTADTTQGTIHFHEWLGDSWGVLFSHPKDFTPVCTTELGYVARIKPEFDKRNVKVIGLSVDPVDSHVKWEGDIEETQGTAVNFPMIGDADRTVSDLYDMIHPNANDTLTVRSVFIIGPDKKVKLTLTYPASTGRNFDEILRVIDSLQLTAKYKVATPANWADGDDVIIGAAVTDEEAKTLFPQGWKTVKPYLRVLPQPNK